MSLYISCTYSYVQLVCPLVCELVSSYSQSMVSSLLLNVHFFYLQTPSISKIRSTLALIIFLFSLSILLFPAWCDHSLVNNIFEDIYTVCITFLFVIYLIIVCVLVLYLPYAYIFVLTACSSSLLKPLINQSTVYTVLSVYM